MKILLITAFPPSKHNVGGPSALPYYLAKYAPQNFQIDLIYYEGYEKVDYLFKEDLKNVFKKVTKVSETPKLIYYPLRAIQKLNIVKCFAGTSLRHIPSKAIANEILNYDIVWIYPLKMFSWGKRLNHAKTIMTGPDSSYLHYELMEKIYKKGSLEYQGEMLNNLHVQTLQTLKDAAYRIDKRWGKSDALIHVVGEDDLKMFNKLGGDGHSIFSLHPYYQYDNITQSILDTEGKLTVLIAGANHSIYWGHFLDRIVDEIEKDKKLASHYKFVFLGKGFDNCYKQLSDAGFETELFVWIDNYEDFIAKAHIQICPIILGTGTKGKVLSAFVTGLLCIGTKHAFENIRIDEKEDCILINHETDVVSALHSVTKNMAKYSEMAERAANKVRNEHSPQKTADEFWGQVVNYFKLEEIKVNQNI